MTGIKKPPEIVVYVVYGNTQEIKQIEGVECIISPDGEGCSQLLISTTATNTRSVVSKLKKVTQELTKQDEWWTLKLIISIEMISEYLGYETFIKYPEIDR